MAIIKQYHKDTGITYVYESESYWDAEKGQSRSKRHVIGKIDPETGEMVPTGKRGPAKKKADSKAEDAAKYETLYSEAASKLKQSNITITRLEQELATEKAVNAKLVSILTGIDKYHSEIEKIVKDR